MHEIQKRELIKKLDLRETSYGYVGLCPYHEEKTPSLSVNFDQDNFECFGCGRRGNLLRLLSKTGDIQTVVEEVLEAIKRGPGGKSDAESQ